MSHVDEGALHAYLDGALEEYPTGEARRIRAHLERCELCAEALTEARRVRDQAELVLSAPTLNVTPPPLEELKRIARSGEVGEGTTRAWGRRQRFGWAASVVLALGIGWVLRGGMPLPTVGPDRAASTAESARAADGDGVSDGIGDLTGAVAEAPSVGATDAGATDAGALPAARQRSENAAEAEEAPARIVVAEALEGSVPSDDRSVMAEARPAAEATAPEPAAPAAFLDVDGTSVDVGQAGRMDDELDVPVDIAATTFESDVPGPMEGAPAESADVAVPVVANEREAAPRSDAARLSLASRSAGAGTALARGIERGAAGDEARSDTVSEPGSLVVPGLEVLSIVWREEGVVPAGVRVIQRLAEGQELELIHLPAGFDPSAVEPAGPGINELVMPRDQGWLILRAPLEEPELRLLLERMDAPDPRR